MIQTINKGDKRMNVRLKNVQLTIGESMNFAHVDIDSLDNETRLQIMPLARHCPDDGCSAKYEIDVDDHMVIFIYE